MIHIEDKLKRTNVYIKRDNVEVNYLTKEEFEGEIDKANAKIRGIYSRINNYATEEDFNKEVEKINGEIETINAIIADSNEAYQNGYNEGIEEQKNRLSSISITENGVYSNDNGYNEVTVNVEMLPTDGGYDKGFADGEQAAKDKMIEIQITENGIYEDSNGYKSIYVDVKQDGGNVDFSLIGYDNEENGNAIDKINEDIAYSKSIYDAWDSSKTSARWRYSYNTKLVYFPKIDTSNVTDMESMFYRCSSLTAIPQLITSKVTDMYGMFIDCSALSSIQLLDTSNVTDMGNMFDGCSSLSTIPQLDTSNVSSMSNMFAFCSSLKALPLLDTSKVTNISYIFGSESLMQLTDLGGFKNLKIDLDMSLLPNLTYQSILNVINNLYDFRGNGDTTTTRTLKIHSNSMATLTDEDKALATNKGWVLIS